MIATTTTVESAWPATAPSMVVVVVVVVPWPKTPVKITSSTIGKKNVKKRARGLRKLARTS